MWQSKLGDIKTKDAWLQWADDFYNNLGKESLDIIKKPDNIWNRIVKVLGLQHIGEV